MPARQDGSQMELSLGTRPGAQQWASARGYLPGNPFCSLLLLICFNSSTLEARKFSNCCSAANGFGKWACHGLRLCTLQVFPLVVAGLEAQRWLPAAHKWLWRMGSEEEGAGY